MAFSITGFPLHASDIAVVVPEGSLPLVRLAADELLSHLKNIYTNDRFTLQGTIADGEKNIVVGLAGNPMLAGLLRDKNSPGPEGYVVTVVESRGNEIGLVAGADELGVMYGVLGLLKQLGYGFYLSFDTSPSIISKKDFSFREWRLTDVPLVHDRLVFNWHNFLSGCSTWNLEQWNSWTLQSQKMGYNAIMVHAYGNNPMVSFTFNGKTKPVGYLSTTVRGRDWSTMHVNDVRRLFGGEVFNDPVFGADAGMVPEEQKAAAAQKLMQGVFQYAGTRSMNVFFAVDVDTVSANPQDLIMTLPESARFAVQDRKFWLPNPDTLDGYKYYKAQVEALMAAYPQITELVAWFRTGGTPWLDLKVNEMPQAWQEEYEAAIGKRADAGRYWRSHNMFAISKIVRAFDKALKEIGHGQVRICSGTWYFTFLPACDFFMPRHVKLIGLDYDVLHNKSVFDVAAQRQLFADVAAKRSVIPIAWAHHDDGNYVGRSYTPFPKLHSTLTDMNACGFGVIHWTTRPLDLFFLSLSDQVWSATKDRPLRLTCDDMAGHMFGEVARATMGEYLWKWITSAPKFGRETSDYFIDRPLTNIMEVVDGCKERLKVIDRVDLAGLSSEQKDRLNYFRGLEEFIKVFFLCQDRYQRSQQLLKKGDLSGARTAMLDCSPEQVIRKFTEFGSLGGITRGEQGLVVTLNTRWLSHYVRHRQILGVEPVRYRFSPTSHDSLAQSAGRFTFHFDENHDMWQCLGEQEIDVDPFVLDAGKNVFAPARMPEVYAEVCRSGIESDKSITLVLQPILARKGAHEKVPAGDYKARLIMLDPSSTAAGQRVFNVSVAAGVRDIRELAKEQVDIFKEAGGVFKVAEHVYSLHLDCADSIRITLTPVKGKALICGAVLEPVKSGVP